MTLPMNTKVLAAEVSKVITDEAEEAERQYYMIEQERWLDVHGIPVSDIVDAMERDAVSAAKDNDDWTPLADLLVNGNVIVRDLKLDQRDLLPATKLLMARKLRGEFKVGRGRRKQTADQRRANNPVHDAAAEVPVIENILRRRYPKRRGYRDRAIDVAAYRAGIDRERLANHLRSPHRFDRRT